MSCRSQLLRALRGSASSSGGRRAVSLRTNILERSLAHSRTPARCIATTAPRLISQTRVQQSKLTSETYPQLERDARFAQVTPEHVARFREILGDNPSAIIDGITGGGAGVDAADFETYNEDWMHKYKGQSKLVLRPGTTDEVSGILKYCNEQHLAVVPQGGNTGLVGGSIPVFDEIVISMARMNEIRSFDEVSGSLVIDAGCVLETVDSYLAQKGYIFPLDLGAKGSCHVGGNVATNAGGLRLLRYGSLHGTVLGVEAVLPNGTIINDLCTLRKNNTGYDVKQLFIGAEGTLGIITKIAIQCPQRSPAVNVAVFGIESYDKAQLAFREAKKQLSEILSAFELMDGRSQRIVSEVKGQEHPLEGEYPFYCLIETSGSNGEHDYAKLETFLEDVMTREVIADGVVAQDETQLRNLWGWREGITECLGHWGGTYKYDISIPLDEMYTIVEDTKARLIDLGLLGDTPDHPVVDVLGYGHMGDSNLHLNIPVRRYDSAVEKALEPWVYEWIQKRSGSISAEHGLGIAKKKFIGYSRDDTTIGLMKQIKNLFDPNGIMNPYNCGWPNDLDSPADLSERDQRGANAALPHTPPCQPYGADAAASPQEADALGQKFPKSQGKSLASHRNSAIQVHILEQCSNERPYCQKCVSSGRQCEGYERERVFITGTPQNKGRVASHPKKGSSSKKGSSPLYEEPSRTLGIAPVHPLTSAWDDHTLVSNQGVEYSVLVSALHTRLPYTIPDHSADDSTPFRITFPPYTPTDLQSLLGEGELGVRAQCLARLPSVYEQDDSAQSYCVFFFEHETAYAFGESGSQRMRRMGPAYFSHFPNHHFFVRVYRPLATGFALLRRQDTFVSSPDWKTIPWQRHPKSLLDHLLDLVLLLPAILSQVDQIVPSEPTLHRRHSAQQLLRDCLSLERHLDAWFQMANRPSFEQPVAYWTEELISPGGLIPFTNSYAFRDANTGLAFLYYWMTQILFHQCIESLHRAIYQPVIDAYPNMWPDLPFDLQIDLNRYQHGRMFAADICRGLDSVLHDTVQPDMLIMPMTVAMDFYRDINSVSQDGLMEIMWIDNFRSRLIEKGQHVAGVLQSQTWSEVATF
ncbi:d-lactate dehydrogenase (cytochrome) [Fusarium mexicanum]|uniref:D-lactate dehydrogenase (cytochrome) n=1 Tax=Fusarium mexicanum TaxID=751941 RepID=A0A8H5JHQ7_9HYPO|nr:d-lactate dehydrogenase (cytochrome) [Fusarium mexicanum]